MSTTDKVTIAVKSKAQEAIQFLTAHSDEIEAALAVAFQKHAGLPGIAGTAAASLALKEVLNFARIRTVIHVEAGTYTLTDLRTDSDQTPKSAD